MRFGLILSFLLTLTSLVHAQEASSDALEIYGNSCEKTIAGESRASARLRAVDKAVFLGVKKLENLNNIKKILNDHDMNVFIYPLVDEYIEDLNIKEIKDDESKICVEIKGWLNPNHITTVRQDFIQDEKPINEATSEEIKEVIQETKKEIIIKPDNPENLALLHIKPLEFHNGTKSEKYAQHLKDYFKDNPYFYLTEDSEIADYVVTPKVLKAKVDSLDAGHKRLQMVVQLDIQGIEKDIVSEYQNRFVLFGAEEDSQKTASRLIKKLLEQAGDSALRKIEYHEQLKFEKNTLGRTLSE